MRRARQTRHPFLERVRLAEAAAFPLLLPLLLLLLEDPISGGDRFLIGGVEDMDDMIDSPKRWRKRRAGARE